MTQTGRLRLSQAEAQSGLILLTLQTTLQSDIWGCGQCPIFQCPRRAMRDRKSVV